MIFIDFNKPDFVDGDVKYWLDRGFTKLFKILNPDYRLFIVQEGDSKKTYVLYENETPIHEDENCEAIYLLTQTRHFLDTKKMYCNKKPKSPQSKQ